MAARPITPHEELRRRCGYTVTGLAKATGFSHSYVCQVEGRRVTPSLRYRQAVAQTLGLPEPLLFPAE
jgi:transcriptional regulator with XRE-family HTH domain